MEERIYAANYATLIRLYATSEGLEVMTDVGDEATTVVLDDDGVRNLRLALTRYERARKKEGEHNG